jgi:hypothetical protein
MTRSEILRRRNLYTALMASLAASTFLFYPSQSGMAWMMWRDTPLLAIALMAGAAFFAFRLRRLPGPGEEAGHRA